MQKYNDPCINTSAFAKLCNTNKRTLIHYDEIGLFQPAYTDERGYRFYSESQCDIFFTITCLKDLGMPLKEIRTYIRNRNPEDLTSLLLTQQKKVQQELLHLKRIEQVIKNKLELVSEGTNLPFDNRCSDPYIEKFPEETFITTPYLGTVSQKELFPVLCEHLGLVSHEKLNIGHPYGAIMHVSDLKQGITDKYAYFMTKTEPDFLNKFSEGSLISSEDSLVSSESLLISSEANIRNADTPLPPAQIHIKPAGLYAVIYLQGNYYDADDAFLKLLHYIEEEELIPGDYCYKEAVWDELTVEDPHAYITRISIPVR